MKIFNKIQKKIDYGKSICILTEGVNSHIYIFFDHFKSGYFFVSIIKKRPIIPFSITDIQKKFQNSYMMKKCPGKIKMKQHHSIETKNLFLKDKDFFKKECFYIIKYQLKKFYHEKITHEKVFHE